METEKTITVLGSTGSIGTQTLEVAERQGYRVTALAAGKNVRLAEEQARHFQPEAVAMADDLAAADLGMRLADTPIRVFSGAEGVVTAARLESDICVGAIVGTAGLAPVLAAIETGHRIALANKETLVCAGPIVKAAAKRRGVEIVPVDSEHSAIYRCIGRNSADRPSRITLTASGGAFRGYTREQMENVTLADALKHPNWSMGPKVTVDSASLVNKGLELMEAVQLFDMSEDRIDILIHPQSIVHSLIEYDDGAMLAQLGVPDMRTPIAYALTGNGSGYSGVRRLMLQQLEGLTFFEPDTEVYPALRVARECARLGGCMPTVFNAAAEMATGLFMREKIRFTEMADIIAACVDDMEYSVPETLEQVLDVDEAAREWVRRRYE